MALIAKKTEGGSFELPPEGTFQGVVFAVYDGGKRRTEYQGKESIQHKIKLGIELDELYTTGKFAGSRITRYPEYTLSTGDKSKLLPVIESIIGKALTEEEKEAGYDIEKLIGKNCTVTIFHKTSQSGKLYAENKIGAILKNTPLIEPILKPDYIPEFIKKWIIEGDFSTDEQTTHGEDIFKDNQENAPESISENDLMNYEILQLIKSGEITMGDYKTQILKECGTPKDYKEIEPEKFVVIYEKLLGLKDFKKTGVRPPQKRF